MSAFRESLNNEFDTQDILKKLTPTRMNSDSLKTDKTHF